MAKTLGFDGIGAVNATFKVASGTTATVGMAVAFTGNGEVGKGSEGNALAGIVVTEPDDGLVTVQIKGCIEDVDISGTSAKQPAVGDVVAVDGAGKLVKLGTFATTGTTVVATVVGFGGRCISVDTTAKKATILM